MEYIFALIWFTEIYKIYEKSKYIYKEFTLKKLDFTKYRTDNKECDNEYKQFNKAIIFDNDNIYLTIKIISLIRRFFKISDTNWRFSTI